jgi:hypothetical protein
LIHQGRHRKERERWLKTLEPHGATRADHRHGPKSCQDLREHSSTRHQQGRNHRNDSGRLRLDASHCGACGRVTAGHGAFTAEMHTLRSNVVSPAGARLTMSSALSSGRVLEV